MRELQLYRAVAEGQPVRLEGEIGETGSGEHGADVDVEAVANDSGLDAARPQLGDQRREAWIDALAGD